MADEISREASLREVRDTLRAQLALLDELGEGDAAIEVNSAIEILSSRLGEPPSEDEIAALSRQYFSN